MNAWQKIVLSALLLFAGQLHAEDTVHYYYTDPQGTVLAKADASGNVTATYDYAPYGSQALGTPPDGPGYTGHVNDPDTGLVYMQARYYDPAVGRFLSVDPVTPSPGNTFNFNRYDYANNNPAVHIDPDGRKVKVVIVRDTYTKTSVTSTISVTSDKTAKSFKGYTLEDTRAGDKGNKDPIQPGKYNAHTRNGGSKGFRLELEAVPNFKNVQIHVGNTVTDVEGCFATGNSRSEDRVGGSRAAMSSIRSVVHADKSGQISVEVYGSSTRPLTPPPVDSSLEGLQ